MSTELVNILLTLEVTDNSPVTLGCQGAVVKTCKINAPHFQIASKHLVGSCVFFVPIQAEGDQADQGQGTSRIVRQSAKSRPTGKSRGKQTEEGRKTSDEEAVPTLPEQEVDLLDFTGEDEEDSVETKQEMNTETDGDVTEEAQAGDNPVAVTPAKRGKDTTSPRSSRKRVAFSGRSSTFRHGPGRSRTRFPAGQILSAQWPNKSKYDGLCTYESDSKCWVCVKCKYTSRRVCGIKMHINAHLKESQETGVAHSTMRYNNVVTCDICGHSIKSGCQKTSQDLLKTHKYTKHRIDTGEVHQCPECAKTFQTILMLRGHINAVHKCLRVRCPVQGCNSILRARSLKSHTQIMHSAEPRGFICHLCGRSFSTNYYLTRHMKETKAHAGERKYLCEWPECGKAFLTRRHLKVHKRLHSEEMPYQCELCGYRARQNTSLLYHRRKHHPDVKT